MPAIASAGMIEYPSVKLQALDKATARTITMEAKVGDTIEYGSIFIKIQACRKAAPLDKPESASFLQIWEVPLNSEKSEWVFSGWMFASSPALSAMDHPVYDVWVLDCAGKGAEPIFDDVEPEEDESKTEETQETEESKSEEIKDLDQIISDETTSDDTAISSETPSVTTPE